MTFKVKIKKKSKLIYTTNLQPVIGKSFTWLKGLIFELHLQTNAFENMKFLWNNPVAHTTDQLKGVICFLFLKKKNSFFTYSRKKNIIVSLFRCFKQVSFISSLGLQ